MSLDMPGVPPIVQTATPVVRVPKKPWKLEIKPLSEVEEVETNWLWYPYIPAAAMTLLFGRGGIGKSFLTCSLAADLSQGRPLPGQTIALPPQKILMVSAEDDAGRIIKPRMKKLGADMRNIFVSDETFVLDERGVKGLETAMEQVAATVVFLDPLVSYLGGKMDINKSNENRAMMGPLGQAAARTGCAVVVVHHENKGNVERTINKALGSVDIVNSVRSALFVGETQHGDKYMQHVKHNWSSPGASLAYVVDRDVFQWKGRFEGPMDTQMPSSSSVRNKAQEFLHDALKDGPVAAMELFKQAQERGIPVRTLSRAKIGVAHSRRIEGLWVWELDAREGLGDVLLKSGAPAVLSPQLNDYLAAAKAKLGA